nr:hypothetical protein [Bacteroidaceae bacterium]
MTKLYFRTGLTCTCFGLALASFAGVDPKVKPETLVDGNKYVLVNKSQSSTQYMSRTDWDGALYFLGEKESNYANYALKAIKNKDNTWSFTIDAQETVTDPETNEEKTQDVTYYLILPQGSANVNVNSTDQVKWILDPKEGGFYNLILGEGNNSDALGQAPYTPTKDIRMHLNAGNQYVCATYYNGPWFPDCYGGITQVDDEMTGNVLFSANDSTSFNWGFVSVENIPAYMADLEVVNAINKFEAEYGEYEGYEEGVALSVKDAAAIYNAANYNENEEDANTITSMISTKIALYNEINNAIALNIDNDKTLEAAIITAVKTFNSKSDATSLETATNDLKTAEKNYSLGTGDITALGVNMSFEDLTAQNGSETTGVAGAPTGWNIYINGTQVTTADEVKAAGIANWHGVNADCSGDIKDGNYGFGLWVSSVPNYEISQTIKDLENGTYIVTAGLMVGANGNGSRRTTQRIFANLSSTYFGVEGEYDESQLDNSEVYGFANNSESTTDTEMQPVEVRAFVYDGTLTFGLRTDGNIAAANRTSSNGSGGDGWFKTDNYRIQKVGYDATDAYNTFNHYFNCISNYYADNTKMAESMMAKVQDAYNKYEDVSESNTQAELIDAILATKSILASAEESISMYEKLNNAITEHDIKLRLYINKSGRGDYEDAIDEASDQYEEGKIETMEEVDAIISKLDAALQACIQSDEIEEGADLTEYIQNPSFEDLSNQNDASSGGVAATPKGWNMYINGTQVSTAADINAQGVTGWCAINEGDAINVELEDGTIVSNQYSEGTHLWGIWNATIPEIELSQEISGLPAGLYTLTCDVLVQYNWAGNCLTTQRIFANDYVAMYSTEDAYENNLPDDAKIAAEIDALVPDAEIKHL